MSRRRNRKRRKDRKDRSQVKAQEVVEWIASTPGHLPRSFLGKERSGDVAELRLEFGADPVAYDASGCLVEDS